MCTDVLTCAPWSTFRNLMGDRFSEISIGPHADEILQGQRKDDFLEEQS